ncbi:MAG: V-type ATP synthase subunit E [Clostridiales bacterium]|jgi:vacuolar-type H+-ATPase subunit E/Vma4|nr:V-type ATP synthase subunit E [Clostridiales bacterium]
MTNAKRKLEYFSEIITRETETKKRRALHQLANDLGKSTATEIAAAEEKMKSRVEAKRREIIRKSNRKIAEALARAKAEYFAARNALEEKLNEDVIAELKKFTQSEKYENYLVERINLYSSSFRTVKFRPQDMHLAEKIAQATGLQTQAGENDFMGGFILQNEKIQADYTFKTRLEKALRL